MLVEIRSLLTFHAYRLTFSYRLTISLERIKLSFCQPVEILLESEENVIKKTIETLLKSRKDDGYFSEWELFLSSVPETADIQHYNNV